MMSYSISEAFENLSINNDQQIAAIRIQSIVRMHLINKLILIPSSKYQTKNWRKLQQWYSTGKSNECEKYQIQLIEQISHQRLAKTPIRINMLDNKFVNIRNPLQHINGFEYTENFDGIQKINDCTLYYNLKFVCDIGGAQTRSLREVYHFIKAQRTIVLNSTKKYFINILDGDTSHKHMDKYLNLFTDIPTDIKKYLFIGDMAQFQKFWLYHFESI